MEKTSNRFTVRRLAVTGLLSALVFVFSWIQIPIGEVARIHLGNVFCALSGLLFGPLTLSLIHIYIRARLERTRRQHGYHHGAHPQHP